jgi:hypothetical protein
MFAAETPVLTAFGTLPPTVTIVPKKESVATKVVEIVLEIAPANPRLPVNALEIIRFGKDPTNERAAVNTNSRARTILPVKERAAVIMTVDNL